jgi:hypothetical protein
MTLKLERLRSASCPNSQRVSWQGRIGETIRRRFASVSAAVWDKPRPGTRVVPTRSTFLRLLPFKFFSSIIMPNHMHLLLKLEATPLSKIIKELKRYPSRAASRILRREGAFRAEDYWDTYMRDAEHELQTRRYIEGNPVKALLVCEPKEWPWSSARLRDEKGVLSL